MRTPIRIGSAKKNQNSWTSGGVLRKNSTNTPAGSDDRAHARQPQQGDGEAEGEAEGERRCPSP